MPKTTVRASAGTLPKANPHPDTAIFKLVELAIAAGKALEAADAVEKAEECCQGCQRPAACLEPDSTKRPCSTATVSTRFHYADSRRSLSSRKARDEPPRGLVLTIF